MAEVGRATRAAAGPRDATAAMEIAVGYLGTRPRTQWETERRLRRAGTPEPVITQTVERLGEIGYLDDAAFARWWGEQRDRHAPRGLRMIEAELRQHGVPREVIEAYREEHSAPERLPRTRASRRTSRVGHDRRWRGACGDGHCRPSERPFSGSGCTLSGAASTQTSCERRCARLG